MLKAKYSEFRTKFKVQCADFIKHKMKDGSNVAFYDQKPEINEEGLKIVKSTKRFAQRKRGHVKKLENIRKYCIFISIN